MDPLVWEALAQAGKATAAVNAAALLHLARVINTFEHAEAERVLDRGLSAANALEEPDRSVLLGQAVSLAATVSPDRAIRLAPTLSDDMPGGHMTQALFDMMSHGHEGVAVEYLTNPSFAGDYPFGAAVSAIGRARSEDTRRQILRAAIRAVRAQSASGQPRRGVHGPSDFTFLFRGWWRLLPEDEARTVVRDLVRTILEEPDQRTRASWNDVRFSSTREHRLFEIFGPLKHLDPERAAALVHDHPQLAAAVAQFPYGPESIESAVPAQSVAPPPGARVEPPDYVAVGHRLVPIPEAVRTDFKEAFEVALSTYATDSDFTRPNDAPQECWPSALQFRNILYKAGQHEGRTAVRHLDRIPDPTLRLFAQIELAAALAGLPQIGGRTISPGPMGFRRSMAMRAREQQQGAPPMRPLLRQQRPARKPDLAPADQVRITPASPGNDDGPSGGSGADFWVIANARLRPVLAHLYDERETRIDLPPLLENRRFDFALVIGQNGTQEKMTELMRGGIEKHFGVSREIRSMDVDIVTAPNGVRAIEARRADGFGFGSSGLGTASIGFAQRAPGRLPQLPEQFLLMEIMDLHMVPSERRLSPDEKIRAMRKRMIAFGTPGSGMGINSVQQALTMAELCQLLEGGLERPLVDETRLTSTYEISAQAEVTSTREFLQVLAETLGLVVTPGRRDISFVVVRHSG